MALSNEDREEMTALLNAVLDSRDRIDKERHRADHEFIDLLRAQHQARQELWKKFQTSLVGGAALAVLGGLGWIGALIIEHFHRG